MVQRLKILYQSSLPILVKELASKNYHRVPKLKKIQLNRSLGLAGSNMNILTKSIKEFTEITGQFPIVTKSKKAVSGFKIRENMDLGISITLRGNRMYDFLDKLIHLTLPQIRDFRGINSKKFDSFGNLNFGINDQLIFPELNYNDIDQTRGFDINIVTNCKTDFEAKMLLTILGFPFSN
jgi:large subunit ribosomal protein L5